MTAPTRTRPETQISSNLMRAVTQDRYGTADVLHVTDIERPQIAADQVLIRVHAAAIDRGTEHLMTGLPYLIRIAGYGFTKPKQPVLGLDVAGRVIAVGGDVTRFAVGDDVVGIADGSIAEFAAADENKLAHKPANLSFEHAAASAVSGITALQALTDVAQLQPGQRVLVVGASGGVGTFAVQLATALGAVVHGVAGRRNLGLVASLGAEAAFDYATTALGDIAESYDVIVDIGGRNSVRTLRRKLTDRGTLVIVGGENGNRLTGGIGRQLWAVLQSPFVPQRLKMFLSSEDHVHMDRLAEFLASEAVLPAIGRRFSLDETPEAMREMAAGRTSGKSVIAVRATDGRV